MLHSCASFQKATKTFLLTAVLLVSTLFSFAHRVEIYSSTGCASGNTVTITGYTSFAPSNTYYNYQYKDNGGVWKCFTASSVINGVTFTGITGFSVANVANATLTLSIPNATTALENVQVRLLMRETASPCGAPAGTTYGGDDLNPSEAKMYRIHIYTNVGDCGGTTPGCIGNLLTNGAGYYGGFENMVLSNSSFTNNNFIAGAGTTDYTQGGNNTTAPATSGSGTYQILNNPFAMNSGNGKFAPHSGNFQMVIHGAANSQKKAWYKTVTVMPGSIYNLSAWVSRTQGSNTFSLKLTANGVDITSSAVSTSVGIWNKIAGSYTVPAGVTSIVIAISDVSTSADRFYSLDDICFTQTSALMSLGNRVFYDTDNSGVNNSDNGIQGVTVNLYRDNNGDNVADGASIATDVTDVDGFYSFDNLTPGNYIVGAVTPAGYMSSSVNGGDPDNNIDLDDNGQVTVGNETRGLGITLSAGAEPGGNTNGTYDFGFLPDCACTTAASNLLVNGSFENGTTGWLATGGTLTTGTGYVACGAANGFNNWSAGTSKVYQDVNTVPGAVLTFKGFAGIHTPGLTCSPTLSLIFLNAAGGIISQSNVAVTRDVDVNHGQLQQYVIVATAPAATVKVRVQSSTTCNTMKLDAFCLTAVNPTNYTLGNTVWHDLNNNGTQDAGEPGIQGVVVKLYDCAGTYLNKTVTTGVNGIYQFTALPAGSYIVGITTPAGYVKGDVGATNVGADNQNDGVNTVGTEIRTACFTTTGSTNNIDFGLKATGSIGDFVFSDNNGNGIQDAGEPGIGGVTVTLSAPGMATRTTVTLSTGAYVFTNLPAATYTVTFSTPAGLTATTANAGTDDTKDSDPVGGTVTVVLAAGQTNLTIDAGFYAPVGLGNYVWYDKNNDGIQNTNEHGLPGVMVKLYKDVDGDNLPDGAFIASATTIANGLYNFTNLAPGKYIVGITQPTGYGMAYTTATGLVPDNNNATDNNGVTIVGNEIRSNFITLQAGTEPDTAVDGDGTSGNLTLDFGLKGLGTIGDFVFRDVNRDGVQQASEPGLDRVVVTLTYPDGEMVNQFSDADGAYSFKFLAPGTYNIGFATPQGGYIPAAANAGTNDLVDSDPVNGVVNGIVLAAFETNNSIDAGFVELISLSGNVWHDVNGMTDNLVNNTGPLQTPPAANIPTGLRAVLVDANTGVVLANALVLGNGTYNFPDVMPGNYTIVLSAVPGTIGQQSPPGSLPTGWVNTGEKLGLTPGRDLVVNGKLSVSVGTTDVTNANFGIQLSNDDGGVN